MRSVSLINIFRYLPKKRTTDANSDNVVTKAEFFLTSLITGVKNMPPQKENVQKVHQAATICLKECIKYQNQ